MTTPCSRPCPIVAATPRDRSALADHLLSGASCVDVWIALADLVETPSQRLDCYARAFRLAQDDRGIEMALLDVYCEVHPGDRQAEGRRAELRALQAIAGHTPKVFRPRDPAPTLGELLLKEAAVSEDQLRRVLDIQRRRPLDGRRRMLGDLLIEQGILTPHALVRILIRQFQERRARGDAPQGVGEYLVTIGAIGESQLEAVLLEQTQLRHAGRPEQLGTILVRRRMVSKQALERAVAALDETAQSFLK